MATKTSLASLGSPNQTLYCTNLPDKLKKPDLRNALYMLFSTYGPVLDVVAMRTKQMRGQAHVVFRDVQTSTQALRALQGFEFFGKPMKIVYAKGSSDIIAKLRGTYVPPTAAPAPPPVGGGPGVQTELQKSIFNAPPSSAAAPTTTTAGTAAAQAGGATGVSGQSGADEAEQRGVKRPREGEEGDDGARKQQKDGADGGDGDNSDEEDAAMDEDSDAPMDASSDDEE